MNYKNNFEIYHCICGSKVQTRNIGNHLTTHKHKRFLFNNSDLLEDYEDITRYDTKVKMLFRNKKRMIDRLKLPIVLSFD